MTKSLCWSNNKLSLLHTPFLLDIVYSRYVDPGTVTHSEGDLFPPIQKKAFFGLWQNWLRCGKRAGIPRVLLYHVKWCFTNRLTVDKIPSRNRFVSTNFSHSILFLTSVRIVGQGQEAKYVECWPNTTSAWAGWSRFDIPVDRYGGVHSQLICTSSPLEFPTCHQASQQGSTCWAKYQKADRASTLCTLWDRGAVLYSASLYLRVYVLMYCICPVLVTITREESWWCM
jgi:hypothetical protein